MRRYEDGDPEGVGSVFNLPDQIAALTGAAVQQAAQTYLNTDNYVSDADAGDQVGPRDQRGWTTSRWDARGCRCRASALGA